jgi:hypothetical protein
MYVPNLVNFSLTPNHRLSSRNTTVTFTMMDSTYNEQLDRNFGSTFSRSVTEQYKELAAQCLLTGNLVLLRKMLSAIVQDALDYPDIVPYSVDTLVHLGVIAVKQKHFSTAQSVLHQAEQLARQGKVGDCFKSKISEVRGGLYAAVGRPRTAVRFLSSAINAERAAACPDRDRLRHLLKSLTLIYIDLNMQTNACETCTELLELQ